MLNKKSAATYQSKYGTLFGWFSPSGLGGVTYGDSTTRLKANELYNKKAAADLNALDELIKEANKLGISYGELMARRCR